MKYKAYLSRVNYGQLRLTMLNYEQLRLTMFNYEQLRLTIKSNPIKIYFTTNNYVHCDYTDVGNGALRTSSMADTLTVRVYFYQYLHPCNSSLLEFLAAKPPLGVLNFRCNQYVYSGNNAP